MLLAAADASLWEYAERYLGVGTRTYSKFASLSELDVQYDPLRGAASFDLISYVVPPELGTFVANSIKSTAVPLYQVDESFILPIHPEIHGRLGANDRRFLSACEPGPRVTVAPSANARTVFVHAIDGEAVEPHFLKLHFPARLSRFTRELFAPKIRLELWVAEELVRIGCPVYPEVAGGYLEVDGLRAWGFLLRDAIPIGCDVPQLVVPLFALYGTDAHAPADPTLIEQLVARSGERASQYLGDRIIRPMVRMWLSGAQECGLVLEMHGQNTLFGFSGVNPETQIIYRDGGICVDPSIRDRRGCPPGLPPLNVISHDVQVPAGELLSLAYDSFLGHHALSTLASLAEERLGMRAAELHAMARDEFQRVYDGSLSMPDTVYYYDDQLYADGDFTLIDTCQRPAWR